tara:strand:+ start:882 stop:1625 length:744 start_codon:yes stop_codon:yes gene_type:complete
MTNPVALITGSSRGIGAATAVKFAKKGINIVINYHNNKEKAEEVANKVSSYGIKAVVIKADISKEVEIIRMFDKIKKDMGNISYLVNNAALSNQTINIEDINFDKLENIFKVNFFSTVICCKEALKHMKQINSNNKAIVNVSSEAGKFGGRSTMAHYASTKAALNIFTKSIARDFINHGIRVNAVSPAVIDTDVHKNINIERKEHFQNTIPMKRMGKTEEVAELIYFLISNKSSYINGEVISINGGK